MPKKKLHVSKIFVDLMSNSAVIVCPRCERSDKIDVSKIMRSKQIAQMEYRCNCGNEQTIIFERRKFYRKAVSLNGFFSKYGNRKKYQMTVLNISRRGLRFETGSKLDMKIGERLFVEFRLSNEQSTPIRREIIIRDILDGTVGAEFKSRDPKDPFDRIYDKTIGEFTFSR